MLEYRVPTVIDTENKIGDDIEEINKKASHGCCYGLGKKKVLEPRSFGELFDAQYS